MDAYVFGSAFLELSPKSLNERIKESNEYLGTSGGSATNTAVAASKLGLKVGLLSCVGDDEIGKKVLNDLRSYKVITRSIRRIRGIKTGISFYEYRGKKKVYYFYRFPGYSDPENYVVFDNELVEEVQSAKVFHFTEATIRKKEKLKEVINFVNKLRKDMVVVYDSNLRLDLWKSKEDAIEASRKAIEISKVVTMNEKEAKVIFESRNLTDALIRIAKIEKKVFFIKRGSKGCLAHYNGRTYSAKAFSVKVIDDTGAGDCFSAGVIFGILRGLSTEETTTFSNAVAALKISKHGGLSAIPNLNEVLNFLKKEGHKKLVKKIVKTKTNLSNGLFPAP
ncbi:MAG: sugar kinase [Thermoproteota archaeon]|nr:sugar kinase [Candidatus Brockarchaeota archaeon]